MPSGKSAPNLIFESWRGAHSRVLIWISQGNETCGRKFRMSAWFRAGRYERAPVGPALFLAGSGMWRLQIEGRFALTTAAQQSVLGCGG